MRVFAISDIHGCSATFRQLLEHIGLNKTDRLYILGDYIDRGPDSKGVVDFVLKLKGDGFDLICMKGNHEAFINSVQGSDEWYSWYSQGGKETLKSFGVSDLRKIDKKYLDFFQSLTYYESFANYIMVHAGFNFTAKNPFRDRHAMLWTRDMVYDGSKIDYRKVIHGHTPQKISVALEAYLKDGNNTINLDCGCVYKNKPGMGYLCVFELISSSFFVQKNIDVY